MHVVKKIYHIHHKVYTRLFLLNHFRDNVCGRCGKNKNACRQAWFLAAPEAQEGQKDNHGNISIFLLISRFYKSYNKFNIF